MAITLTNSPAALGAAVFAARSKLGLTPPQLALAAAVGVRFIVELEAGKPTVRLETLLTVVHALGGSDIKGAANSRYAAPKADPESIDPAFLHALADFVGTTQEVEFERRGSSDSTYTLHGISLRGGERRSMAVFICTWLEARVHKDCSNVGCRQDSQRLLRKCNPLRTLQDARALRQLLFVQLRAAAPG